MKIYIFHLIQELLLASSLSINLIFLVSLYLSEEKSKKKKGTNIRGKINKNITKLISSTLITFLNLYNLKSDPYNNTHGVFSKHRNTGSNIEAIIGPTFWIELQENRESA